MTPRTATLPHTGEGGGSRLARLRPPKHPLTLPAVVGAVVAGATALVALVDPGVPGRYPVCPFLLVTGHYCPGCGGLRAVHALAHGELRQALDLNALVVVALPIALVAFARWVVVAVRTARGRPTPPAPRALTSAATAIAALLICVVFGVLRNLPAFAVLAP